MTPETTAKKESNGVPTDETRVMSDRTPATGKCHTLAEGLSDAMADEKTAMHKTLGFETGHDLDIFMAQLSSELDVEDLSE